MTTPKDYNKIPVKNNMEVGNDAETDSGSQSQSTERPKLQGVVGSTPKKVKRSLFSRLVTGLIGPEGFSGIGAYIVEEIAKPTLKNLIVDAINTGARMAVYGEKGGPPRSGHYNYGGDHRPRTNYNNAYSSRPAGDNRTYGRDPTHGTHSNVVPRSSSRYGVEDYVIEDRHDAAHVLTTLTECADRYGLVSVADYYDLIRVTPVFTDNNYGWRYDAITSARIVPVPGGYIIKFPPVEVL